MTSDVVTSLSPDELALYDRQIRLWGVGTQQLIRQAKVALIVGRQELLFQEILKNLLLNGIGRIALYLLPCDFSSTNGSIFTNLSEWAADLNPTVSLIECSPSLIDYRQHDLVMLIELKEEEKVWLFGCFKSFHLRSSLLSTRPTCKESHTFGSLQKGPWGFWQMISVPRMPIGMKHGKKHSSSL